MKRFFRQYGRLTLALAAVLAFCAVLPLLFQQSRSIETGSWGLSFRTEGQPPVGNASKETLRRYDVVDINVYEANLFHTKMMLKEIDLQNYLFKTDVYELPPTTRLSIMDSLRREMIEIFSGRNVF